LRIFCGRTHMKISVYVRQKRYEQYEDTTKTNKCNEIKPKVETKRVEK